MGESKLRRVVITGTNGALGGTVAEHFVSEGVEVVGLDISYDSENLAEQSANLYVAKLDATDPDQVRDMFAKIAQERGGVDAVIHCAGGFRWSKFDEVSDADIDFLLNVNLRSTMYMVREAIAVMKEAGRGRVVVVSSRSTLNPGVGEGAYAATKAGINAIVKSVAAEVAADDITINAILPSIIDTPPNRAEMPDADFSTWVKRDQLAGIIDMLVGPGGDAINGALLPVSGRT